MSADADKVWNRALAAVTAFSLFWSIDAHIASADTFDSGSPEPEPPPGRKWLLRCSRRWAAAPSRLFGLAWARSSSPHWCSSWMYSVRSAGVWQTWTTCSCTSTGILTLACLQKCSTKTGAVRALMSQRKYSAALTTLDAEDTNDSGVPDKPHCLCALSKFSATWEQTCFVVFLFEHSSWNSSRTTRYQQRSFNASVVSPTPGTLKSSYGATTRSATLSRSWLTAFKSDCDRSDTARRPGQNFPFSASQCACTLGGHITRVDRALPCGAAGARRAHLCREQTSASTVAVFPLPTTSQSTPPHRENTSLTCSSSLMSAPPAPLIGLWQWCPCTHCSSVDSRMIIHARLVLWCGRSGSLNPGGAGVSPAPSTSTQLTPWIRAEVSP
mmetsp:Transcript_61839/g.174287  ORF Transcript_61839/g.174287 Transcript_61839/m.174287 type:complete len:384 (-) Transcript_61839:418-1569(-)